jgi:DNA-binding MarR family transcriptional regulator
MTTLLSNEAATAKMGVLSVAHDDDANRRAITDAVALFDAFREVRHDMPLQHAYTFMLVALKEGKGVGYYTEQAGVAQTVMTRHLLDIGEQNRKREPGYGLVEKRPNLMDLREHQVWLTPKGRTLLNRVLRVMAARR